MPIKVISNIKPANGGQFPVVEDIDIHGGFQSRVDIADRNSIPLVSRKLGMLVFVQADGKFYTLSGGLDNANWSVANLGGAGTGPGGKIVDADVYITAAIQGTKISPDFGKHNAKAADYLYYPIKVPIDGSTTLYWTLDELTPPFVNTGNGGTQSLLMTPFSGGAFTGGLFDGGINLIGVTLDDTLDTPIQTDPLNTTLSCWVNLTSQAGGTIVAKKYDNGSNHVDPFDAISINLDPSGDGYIIFRVTLGGTRHDVTLNNPLSLGAWHHLGCTWDGTNFAVYVDGVLKTTVPLGSNTPIDFSTNGKWFVGNFGSPEGSVDLIVDDIRAESVVRSAQYFDDVYVAGIFPNLATATKAGDIFMAGDLSGDGRAPKVKIGGVNLSSNTPNDGDVLTFVAVDNKWEPQPGGTGVISLGGDVVGSSNANTVIALRNINLSGTAPTESQSLIYSSSLNQWVPNFPSVRKITTVTTGYSILPSDDVVIVNNGGPGNIDVTLPGSIFTPTPIGKVITVLDGLATANLGAKYIRIQTSQGTIIPASDMDTQDYGHEILRNPGQAKSFIWDGTNWHYIHQFIRQEDNGLGWIIIAAGTTTLNRYSQSVFVLTTAPSTVNLPPIAPAAFLNQPIEISIKDRNGTAAANNITISPNGALIDNSASPYVINTNFGFVRFSLSENNWYIVGKG